MVKLESLNLRKIPKNITLTPDPLVDKSLDGIMPDEKELIFPESIKGNLHLPNLKEGLDPKKIENTTLTPDSLVDKSLDGVEPFYGEKELIFPESIKENLHLPNLEEKGLDPKNLENINLEGLNLEPVIIPGNLKLESLVDRSLEGIELSEEQNKVR